MPGMLRGSALVFGLIVFVLTLVSDSAAAGF
jgi:hypothetical protein